ncbi:MAG: tetratricopeptide repeat protein [Thermogutta sp.]|uniref:tetratricopeptide repeat protein n=1 Tax=Thermogutta sp. TaxID=1962930 RepID=UPI00198E5150|nr:tetratricopeptide repeat protein [Thermogutta sp.]MBC7351038.1 tetratricopeptide repeat protein [Thermogutta sp.]
MILRRRVLAWVVVLAGVGCIAGIVVVFLWRPSFKAQPHQPAEHTSSTKRIILPDVVNRPVPQTGHQITEEMDRIAQWLEIAFPDRVEMLELAARLRFHRGELDKAEQLWHRAISIDPTYPFAHHGLAIVRALRGDYETAIREYRETLRFSPRAVEPLLELGDVLIKAGKIDDAIDLLENDFPSTVESIWRYTMLGQCYLHKGDLAKARLMYELALSRDPNDSSALYGLSLVLVRQGHQEEADKLAARLKQVRENERQNEREERRRFDERADLAGKLAEVYGGIARFLLAVDAIEESKAVAHRAIQLQPDQPAARQVLAEIRLKELAPVASVTPSVSQDKGDHPTNTHSQRPRPQGGSPTKRP